MDVFFTTVMRGGPLEQSGELIKVHWETKQLVRREPLIPFDPDVSHDPNPRGNARGGRGILLIDGSLLAASYHSLHVYDLDLNYQRKISHPLFVSLHELAYAQDLILGTSSAIDAVIGIDKSGEFRQSWWPRENPFLQSYLSIAPLEIDKSADHRMNYLDPAHIQAHGHLHLNAVAVHQGQLYVLLNRYGIVYNATLDKIVLKDTSICGCHNLLFEEGCIFINDTKGRRLVIYSQEGTLIKSIDLLKFPEVAAMYKKVRGSWITKLIGAAQKGNIARPIFVRGLFPLGARRVLIGFSPATIIEVDYERETLVDFYQYSDDVRVTPHGLLAVI